MRTTRHRILEIIQRRRAETVGGLARELGLAQATVRRHLDILQRDGLVVFSETRKGSGRPEHSFSLTDRGHEALPKGYDSLLSGLVRELGHAAAGQLDGKSGAEALEMVLTRLGQAVAARNLEPGRSGDTGEQRLATAMKALAELDFEPVASRDESGTRIILSNCPFRSVALNDDAICAYDSAIIQTIVGAPVKRERCLSGGHDRCEYVVPQVGAAGLDAAGRGRAPWPPAGADAAGVDADVGHA
jgi:predicted ArsR family transcriptional regulator